MAALTHDFTSRKAFVPTSYAELMEALHRVLEDRTTLRVYDSTLGHGPMLVIGSTWLALHLAVKKGKSQQAKTIAEQIVRQGSQAVPPSDSDVRELFAHIETMA
jgi:hypothetical protein